MGFGIAKLLLNAPIPEHGSHMQARNFDLAAVVQENDHARGFRMHCRMIGRWNEVLLPIACPDRERLKWRRMQKLSNPRNHDPSVNGNCRTSNMQSGEAHATRVLFAAIRRELWRGKEPAGEPPAGACAPRSLLKRSGLRSRGRRCCYTRALPRSLTYLRRRTRSRARTSRLSMHTVSG
jgi:hypothetical protein